MERSLSHFLSQDPSRLSQQLMANEADIRMLQALKREVESQGMGPLMHRLDSTMGRDDYPPRDYGGYDDPYYESRGASFYRDRSPHERGWSRCEEEEMYRDYDDYYRDYYDQRDRYPSDSRYDRQPGFSPPPRGRRDQGRRRGQEGRNPGQSKPRDRGSGKDKFGGKQDNKSVKKDEQKKPQQTKSASSPTKSNLTGEEKGKLVRAERDSQRLFYCKLCNIKKFGTQAYFSHILTNRHKGKVKSLPKSEKDEEDKKKLSKYPKGQDYLIQAFQCSVCNWVGYNPHSALNVHCKTRAHFIAVKKHLYKLEKAKENPDKTEEQKTDGEKEKTNDGDEVMEVEKDEKKEGNDKDEPKEEMKDEPMENDAKEESDKTEDDKVEEKNVDTETVTKNEESEEK